MGDCGPSDGLLAGGGGVASLAAGGGAVDDIDRRERTKRAPGDGGGTD
jgi:hypothetical protein